MLKIFSTALACFAATCGTLSSYEKSAAQDFEPITICSDTTCYTLVKQLGEGFFGQVFEGVSSSGQHFAIKTYKAQTFEDLLGDARREFQRGQVLRHPHIVKTIELIQSTTPSEDNPICFYLVLDLIDGTTLSRTPKKALSKDACLGICLHFIDALYYALSKGMFYLDLHAGNVMLTSTDKVMLIDLASFFTFEELFDFAKRDDLKPPKTAREAKLQQFLLKHPQLKADLSYFKQHLKTAGMPPRHLLSPSIAESQVGKEQEQLTLASFSAWYFDILTNVCMNFIAKSNLDREEKIELYTQLKKLAWNYLEDIEEEKILPFASYINQLNELVQP